MQTVFDPYGQNRVQRGGNGVTFDGPLDYSAAGAPIENHGSYSHCDNSFRPPPVIPKPVFMGGWRKGKRRLRRPSRKNRKSQRSRQSQRNQRGGGCGCMGSAPMRGGGSGNGGYGVVLSNENGKVYDSLSVGACPPPQAGGGQVGGAAGDPVYSYPAGYSYGAKSFVEAGNGTAHYADPLPYGSIMTGGKRRGSKRRGSKRSAKRSKKSRKSSKSRKY